MDADKQSKMVKIPTGRYQYKSSHRTREGEFLFFNEGPRDLIISSFYMDQFEVTNDEFRLFLVESGYQPNVPNNFLKHWVDSFPLHLSDHPVTWVSLEDARAYAAWNGKRLPNDVEWQWAAQGTDGRSWPWGDQFDPHYCNSDNPGTTPVYAYPKNRSPFGVCDMVGNVWEWTDQVFSDGWHTWCLIRGGSFYQAKGSSWYAEGGAQPVYQHQKFLFMTPGLDRCSTIGFRCVMSDGITIKE